MPTTPLTPTQLADLSDAGLANAVALLGDAHALLKARRWPRAYALAVLAGEELGKALLCYPAKALAPDDTEGWKKFWDRRMDHRPKFRMWANEFLSITADTLAGSKSPDELWRRFVSQGRNQLAQAGLDGKKSALYVDFDFDKNIVTIPSEVIDKSRARSMVKLVATVVEQTSSVLRRELMGQSATPILAELQAAIDNETSDDDVAAALCMMLRRLRQLPAPA